MGLPDPLDGENEMDLNLHVNSDVRANIDVMDVDGEDANRSNGYQGYSLLDRSDDEVAADDDSDDSDESNNDEDIRNYLQSVPPPDVPPIKPAEQEIEEEIWNTPRNPESENIELDNTKTETILNIMSNFQLSSSITPDWAKDIPEQKWKQDLLQRIRQKQVPDPDQSESDSNLENE